MFTFLLLRGPVFLKKVQGPGLLCNPSHYSRRLEAGLPAGGKLGKALGASQIKGFRPLLEESFPSIYQIFRAYKNTNRWRIIDTMFGKSQLLDARVMFFR